MSNKEISSLLTEVQKMWVQWRDVPLTLYGSKDEWDAVMSTANQILEEHGNTDRVFQLINFFTEELHQRAEQREGK